MQTEEHIDKIMIARDNAANSVRGRGVHLLARLDQMYFEGSLSDAEVAVRVPLYEALYATDEEEIQRILCDERAALGVVALPDDGETPWLARARRLLRHESPLLRKGAGTEASGDALWGEFVLSLQRLVEERDELSIYACVFRVRFFFGGGTHVYVGHAGIRRLTHGRTSAGATAPSLGKGRYVVFFLFAPDAECCFVTCLQSHQGESRMALKITPYSAVWSGGSVPAS
jgi:hypothetical protein